MPDADRSCRPLRVAVVARSVFPIHGVGGLERHVYDLVGHLLARGVHVVLITRQPANESAAAKFFEHPCLETLFVPYRTFPFAGRKGTTVLDRSTAYLLFGHRAGRVAAQLSRRGEVDVVHGLGAASLGYAVARERRSDAPPSPFVFNPQGLEEFGATDPSFGGSRAKRLAYFPLRRAVIRCARAADRVIATDRSLRPVVERHLAPSPDRIRLIPNAIDLRAIDAAADDTLAMRLRASNGIGPDEPVLLSVGRLERNKGFHVLAAALGRVPGRPWRWVLVGAGPMRRELERLSEVHGIRRRAVFAGRVSDSDLLGWYRAATLFVHPTLYEGSSLVTLEAMAHRLAVVGTIAGGLPDKIEPGVTGWLVPPGRADDLAAAIAEALSDPRRLKSMGRAGRVAVESAFSWPVVTEMLLQVYREFALTRPPM